MAASVELQSPARETHTGTCLLNEITDNLVGHHRKSAKTKRPFIGYMLGHACRPSATPIAVGPADTIRHQAPCRSGWPISFPL